MSPRMKINAKIAFTFSVVQLFSFPMFENFSTGIDRDAKKEEQRKSANDRRKNIEFPRYNIQ